MNAMLKKNIRDPAYLVFQIIVADICVGIRLILCPDEGSRIAQCGQMAINAVERSIEPPSENQEKSTSS